MSEEKPGRDDLNALASGIVGRATGQKQEEPSMKNAAAVALGRLGGVKGGRARAQKLSKRRRAEIARQAAKARWDKARKESL